MAGNFGFFIVFITILDSADRFCYEKLNAEGTEKGNCGQGPGGQGWLQCNKPWVHVSALFCWSNLLCDRWITRVFGASGMFYVDSCSVPTPPQSLSLEICRVRWPALPSTIKTSIWTAGGFLFPEHLPPSAEQLGWCEMNTASLLPPVLGRSVQRWPCSSWGRLRLGLCGRWHSLWAQYDVFGETLPPRGGLQPQHVPRLEVWRNLFWPWGKNTHQHFVSSLQSSFDL